MIVPLPNWLSFISKEKIIWFEGLREFVVVVYFMYIYVDTHGGRVNLQPANQIAQTSLVD